MYAKTVDKKSEPAFVVPVQQALLLTALAVSDLKEIE